MIICIPVFGTRVSPRFDCAKEFLIAHIKGENILSQEKIFVDSLSMNERIICLKDSGVNTLICGGIDNVSSRLISLNNIKIYSWITGEAEDALKSLINGNVSSCSMMARGGRRCGKWKFLNKADNPNTGFRKRHCHNRRKGNNNFSPII